MPTGCHEEVTVVPAHADDGESRRPVVADQQAARLKANDPALRGQYRHELPTADGEPIMFARSDIEKQYRRFVEKG